MKHFLTFISRSEDIRVVEKVYSRDSDFLTPSIFPMAVRFSRLSAMLLWKEIRCFSISEESSWMEMEPSALLSIFSKKNLT